MKAKRKAENGKRKETRGRKSKARGPFFALPESKVMDVEAATHAMVECGEFRRRWHEVRQTNEAYLEHRQNTIPLNEVMDLCAYFMGYGMGLARLLDWSAAVANLKT